MNKTANKSAAKWTKRPVQSGPRHLPEWNLDDLYSGLDDPAIDRDLDRADAECAAFEDAYKGKLATLVAAADGGPSLTAASIHVLFFTLELNRIEDAILEKAMRVPALGHYRPWIEDMRRYRPYQLEDRVEQLFQEKTVTAYSAWNRHFDATIAKLRFKVAGKPLAIEPTLNFFQDRSGAKRKAAAQALAHTFKENVQQFALIANTLAKDKEISDRWRGFADIADERHLSNRVEREVVDALVAAVRAAYPRLSHRYYALKAGWFGKKWLPYWDRNAPLPQVPMRNVPWAEAMETVLGAYRAFSPRMADIAARFFTERWIDAPVRLGKAPGAFSHPTTPSVHPYVLVNYQGKPRDVMTLAHELGHGVHQVLAAPNGALMAPTPLTLAETASVFGEMLTFQKLLAATRTKKERKAMLAANTVVRQIAFYTFERAVHTERKSGELTAARIGELWLDVQRESLGPAIELKSGYETFWCYIPHFIHSPFYVYAYAFGDCLVNSLYAVYENAAEGFAERYLAMLSAGGTKHYSELLAPFGLDARDPAFWQRGLGVIERMIEELERLSA
jgi:oligoendopeptidase F